MAHRNRLSKLPPKIGFTCRCLGGVLLLFCHSVFSEEANNPAPFAGDSTEHFFHSGQFTTYNPFQLEDRVKIHRPEAYYSSNEQLEQAASSYHDHSMMASQKALNQQWLQQYHTGEIDKNGSRALQKILQLGAKSFWNALRQKEFKSGLIPDGNGDGQFSTEWNYKVRASDDKFKFTVEYEF